MSRIKLFISVLIFTFSVSLFSQWQAYLERNGHKFVASTENLLILNNFDRPLPKVLNDLYVLADSLLSDNPMGNYAFLDRQSDFKKYVQKHNVKLLGGPMLGNATSESIDIWVRTSHPAKVKVKVSGKHHKKVYGPVATTLKSDLTAIVSVDKLHPGKNYKYEIYVDNQKISSEFPLHLHTPYEDLKDESRIIFGSCYHRMGLGNEKLSAAMIARSPDALLLMGDVAVQDRDNHLGKHNLDFLMRDLFPAWQNLSSKIPVYVTWDDHDYFNNDLYGIPKGYTEKDREAVWHTFKYAWVNPSYGFGEKGGKGVFFKTRIGAADVIMLDNRYFREKANFLGDEQKKWLVKELLNCKGPFIILSCGTMWIDCLSDGKDSWGVYDPETREEIFKLIEENNIPGVLLISGDRHGARGFGIPRESGFTFYEFGAASLGGLFGPPVACDDWDTQFYGFAHEYAFGEFTFSHNGNEPVVTFRFINDQQKILTERSFTLRELTP